MIFINNIGYSDLLLFSITINAVIFCFLRKQNFRHSHSTKLFMRFILSVNAVGVFEIIAWILAIPGNSAVKPYHYLSNVLFFSCNILPVSFGLRYLDYIVSVSREKDRRKFFFYLIPFYLNLGFVLCNLFFDGFLFRVDSDNLYHRGIGIYIINGFTFLFAIVVVIGFLRDKRMITGRLAQVILAMAIIPFTGVVLQTIFYGLSLSIPSYTLAIFISFLLMEKNEMLKDPLTLLNSRAQMQVRLQYKLKSQTPFTAIMMDANGFKHINDCYGHSIGDEVLKDVSRILLSCANYEDFVCRFGGDEFFVILESAKDVGRSYIRRIDQILLEYSANKPYTIALSYGLLYVDHSINYKPEELIRLTDQLMYQDKINKKQEMN